MTNKIYNILFYIILSIFFIVNNLSAEEQFNFDVTNIEILENGKIFKGKEKGIVTTNTGIKIIADTFEYNKNTNILISEGKVEVKDELNNYTILSDKITYIKNKELILAESNSKAVYGDGITIDADNFNFNKLLNSLNANGNVFINDKIKDYKIFADDISYFKNEEKIITNGKSRSIIQSKYEIESDDIFINLNEEIISSNKKTLIKDDKSNVYNLDKFTYLVKKELLKGEDIVATSNFSLPKSDKLFFSDAIIDLKNQNFVAKDTKIQLHNEAFGNPDNNPRLIGVSSKKKGSVTNIEKGIFTSCKINEKCPSWSIQAKNIKHNKTKKQIIYDNAFLRIYDFPILYFPKFFHPDPSVERQSGLLKPLLNNSHILGSSITLPYYIANELNKDFTLTPTLFDKNMQMLQLEYRQVDKKYNLITDFGVVNNYKSSQFANEKSITHLFGRFNADLNLKNFLSSKLNFVYEKVSNDTYLKIFDANITNNTVRPKNFDVLNSEIKLSLKHENYDFTTGFQSYEDLGINNSDRYQFVLPYFKFNKVLAKNIKKGSLNLSSEGTNELKNTNNLKTRLINNISYKGFDFVSDLGIKNNINFSLKNLNSLGKNDTEYKSSPQIELMSNFEINSSLPLEKKNKNFNNYITPKISFKFNPGDMKNYSSSTEKKINIDNVFLNNRLGISDSYEAGRSLTLGVEYKKESLEDINKYFEMKLATVLRDKEEKNIPKISTINRKSSNVFGSVSNNFSKYLNVKYNFAIDNDLNTLEYNNINASVSLNNFVTEFNFLEENGEMGDANIFENSLNYSLDEKNYFTFKTRRNRKLNLTEFYDLVYEYKNDCLIAAIKYKKTYYEDRDLKPSEDLFFSISLVPLTTYEHKLNQ